MIQQAKLSEIEQILAITKACGERMTLEGMNQWNENYPNSEAFQKDIERNELYVFLAEESIIGSIVISTKMDEDYKTVDWVTETSNHYYIHRLAVHPDHQGKGIARKMMDFAENLAIENNLVSIRLDTFSKNIRNQKFYENRGYQRLGNIYFKGQSEFPFYCYELSLEHKIEAS
jgi:ribosomal protein S18 acetylase RimI-like enzyme